MCPEIGCTYVVSSEKEKEIKKSYENNGYFGACNLCTHISICWHTADEND